jgi:predicted dehydrogenase
MSRTPSRRLFLASTAAAASSSAAKAFPANSSIVVGVMGCGGRGTELAKEFAQLENVKVAFVCDPDSERAGNAAALLEKAGHPKPEALADFRAFLDDKAVDVMVCAASNHWHGPATIAAVCAGKHVYVEKPCSHNPREGEMMVEAAAKHRRLVQMGNQRRSWPAIREAIQFIHEGGIGQVKYSQSWYTANRPSIGVGVVQAPPKHLDYELWQGPAPRRPFKSNILHYNWHWFWHWGNGELGNNGVHYIDVSRWGLGLKYPTAVRSVGGRYRFQDDQETPDTHVVSFDFGGAASIVWEGYSRHQVPGGANPADIAFYGASGMVAIRGGGYTVHDPKGKQTKKVAGKGANVEHIQNFLDGIRNGAPLNSPIVEGHVSTLLCHLGNIAHRTGRGLACSPENGTVTDVKEAGQYWSRAYAPRFEPKVT